MADSAAKGLGACCVPPCMVAGLRATWMSGEGGVVWSGTPSPEEDYMAAGRGIVFPDDNPAPEYLVTPHNFCHLSLCLFYG